MVDEEEYDEDDGWLLADDDEDNGEADDEVDADDGNVGDVEEVDDVEVANEDGVDNVDNVGGQARSAPGSDAEQRNEALLMSIMAEGKERDQGQGGGARGGARGGANVRASGIQTHAKTNGEPKKKRKVISSDSDQN